MNLVAKFVVTDTKLFICTRHLERSARKRYVLKHEIQVIFV